MAKGVLMIGIQPTRNTNRAVKTGKTNSQEKAVVRGSQPASRDTN